MERSIEITQGEILKAFNKEETRHIEQKWMDVFCTHKQGVNTKQFKWHIFSSGRYPSISGANATQEYSQHIAAEYIIMSNQNELAITTNTLPDNCNVSDFYVFPPNMAWTMAFTHEDGWLGPYFALHPNYETLNIENEKHRRS